MPAPESTVAGVLLVMARSASGLTSRVALAATALLPALVVSAPTGMVFTCAAPAVDDVTSIEKAQDPLPETLPPVSVRLPAVFVTLPPAQVFAMFGVAATVSPAGNVSVTEVIEIAEAFAL